MSDVIERRVLGRFGDLVIVADMCVDEDTRATDHGPGPGDPAEDHAAHAEYVQSWERREFLFVGLVVRVCVPAPEGRAGHVEVEGEQLWTVADASVWGVEHGHVGGGVDADAWEWGPATYQAGEDGKPDSVVMASNLTSLVVEALATAHEWVEKLRALGGSELSQALRWASPDYGPARIAGVDLHGKSNS